MQQRHATRSSLNATVQQHSKRPLKALKVFRRLLTVATMIDWKEKGYSVQRTQFVTLTNSLQDMEIRGLLIEFTLKPRLNTKPSHLSIF